MFFRPPVHPDARARARDQGDGGAALSTRSALPSGRKVGRRTRVPGVHNETGSVPSCVAASSLWQICPGTEGVLATCPRSRTSRVLRVEQQPFAAMPARPLVLVKPDGMRRGRGEIVGVRAPWPRAARRAPPGSKPRRASITPSTRASRPSVPRRLHLVGPVLALAVSGDHLARAHDDGGHEPARLGAGDDRGDFALELSENIVHGSDSKRAHGASSLFFLTGLVRAGLRRKNRDGWTQTSGVH
jgi:nucleoside-diphosphate kinase